MNSVNGDLINSLPTDQSEPSNNEIFLADKLFKEHQSMIHKVLSQTKDVLFVGVLFVLFSLPQLDTFLQKVVPVTKTSWFFLIGVKTAIFVLIYFVIKNLYLIRK
jgi:hypothetical protein